MLSERPTELEGIVVTPDDLVQMRTLSKYIQLGTPLPSRSIMDGPARSSRRGRGMEFSEVRHYQIGDDIRNIDWRVTARTQETYTKLFQEEKERPVYLLVDQRQTMFFGSRTQFKSVLAAKLAACIAWSAYNNRDKIGALIFDQKHQSDLRPKQGKHALFRSFHELSKYNQALLDEHRKARVNTQTPDISFADMTRELQRVVRPGSLVFILSDFHDFDEDGLEAITLLARHNDISFIQIYDAFESSLPKLDRLSVSNGERRVTLNCTSNEFQQRYSTQWQKHIEMLTLRSRKLGIQLSSLATQVSIKDHLRTVFSNRVGIRK